MPLYVCVDIKITHWKLRILNPKDSQVIYPSPSQNDCLQTYRNNRIC